MHEEILKILQIIFADIILSGDNAIVIGMAAAGIEKKKRKKVIAFGMGLAALLRVAFAVVASYLIRIPGILLVGGLLLAWVCWRFYRDLTESRDAKKAEAAGIAPSAPAKKQKLRSALYTIAVADVSMSIDNVLAVAAIAREDTALLVFGLALAIAFMAFCATLIMQLMTRFPWLSYAGLVFLAYLTAVMIWDGSTDLIRLIG